MPIRRLECRQKWKCCSGTPKHCSSPKGQAKTDVWAVIRSQTHPCRIPKGWRATSHHGTGAVPHRTPVGKKGQPPWKELQPKLSHCPSPFWRSGLTAQAPQPCCCVGTGAGGEGKEQKLFQVTWTHLHQIGLPDTIQLAEVGHRAENSFVLLPS